MPKKARAQCGLGAAQMPHPVLPGIYGRNVTGALGFAPVLRGKVFTRFVRRGEAARTGERQAARICCPDDWGLVQYLGRFANWFY